MCCWWLENRGVEVTSRIAAEETDWEELFLPSDFFSTYPRYLQIDIIAEDPTDHRLWHGWCESRLRQLVVALEQPNYCYSHPFTKCYSRITDQLDGVSSTTSTDSPTNGDGAQSPNGTHRYYVTTFFVGLSFPPALKRINLSRSLQDFLLRVNAWERRKPTMDLRIIPLKQSDIPDFVFLSHSANSTLLEGQSSRYFRAVGEERHFGDRMTPSSSPAPNSGNSEDDDSSVQPRAEGDPQQQANSSQDSETFMVGDVQINSLPRPSVIVEAHQVSPVDDAANGATTTTTTSTASSSNGASENGPDKENGHHAAAWPAHLQQESFDSPSKRPRVVDEPHSSSSAGEDDKEPGTR